MRFETRAVLVLMLGAVACSEEPDRKPAAQQTPAPAKAVVPGRYVATLEEGMRFYRPGLPEFVTEVSGFSVQEPWGRWTMGPVAAIRFEKPLPTEFELVVSGSAYGANIGEPVVFACGEASQSATFTSELGKGTDMHKLAFKTSAPCDRLEIRIPKPSVPPASTGDGRALGIALSSLKIVAK